MSSDSSRKIALVTGSNRGIGLETARQLAGRGFRVVIAARDEAAGRVVVAGIEQAGGEATYLQLDVSDSRSVANASVDFARIAARLDVLINNAGIYPDEGRSILTIDRDLMDRTLQTNCLGALETTQALLPYLRRADSARVINVSSGYGQLNGLAADVPSYCLSKLALNGLTIMLADALRGDRIAVNAMCPGWVRTAMGGDAAPLSVAEGADTAVWLAAEAPPELTGKLFRNRREIAW